MRKVAEFRDVQSEEIGFWLDVPFHRSFHENLKVDLALDVRSRLGYRKRHACHLSSCSVAGIIWLNRRYREK